MTVSWRVLCWLLLAVLLLEGGGDGRGRIGRVAHPLGRSAGKASGIVVRILGTVTLEARLLL